MELVALGFLIWGVVQALWCVVGMVKWWRRETRRLEELRKQREARSAGIKVAEAVGTTAVGALSICLLVVALPFIIAHGFGKCMLDK